MMKIGIVGLGVVGSAIKYGFEKLGHSVKVHDIKLNTSVSDVLDTDICYICVPTPSRKDGGCDISIVTQVIGELENCLYEGIVAIKSTVSPGTTEKLQLKYQKLRICFVPEFLRERCAQTDFTENHAVCIIGGFTEGAFEMVEKSHGKYPNKFVRMYPTEAELCKYYNNIFNATLVTFANSFFTVCDALDVDYKIIKNAMVNIDHIPDKYLDCNSNFRGFGGICLPKDTAALAALCKDKNLNIDFFQMLLDENAKYETTVYEGMRKE